MEAGVPLRERLSEAGPRDARRPSRARLRRVHALALALGCSGVLSGAAARAAEPTKDQCIDANEKAQGMRKSEKLHAAEQTLLICVSASCPGPVRDDCAQRLTELRSVIPTVVFVVKDDADQDLSDVSVTMDDQPLASKLDGTDYSLADMSDDAVAVLDAIGSERAHVMGCSMGGMIVQRLAIDHGDRLLSMTSVMSRTGEPGYGGSSEAALAFLMAPPAASKAAYIENQVAALHVYGSKPEWLDDNTIRDRAAAAYDRCFFPEGIGRQMRAVMHDGSRSEELATIDLPVLVIHGSRDTLIDPSGGRQTAAVIPGARYVEIEGMGHDYPPPVWNEWVAVWSEFVHSSVEV